MLVSCRVEFCSFAGQCQTIRRKCDYIVADRGGNISKPTQPKDGTFERADMARFFPFIADQFPLKEDFKLRAKTCGLSGGTAAQGYRGRTSTGGGDDTGTNGNNGSASTGTD